MKIYEIIFYWTGFLFWLTIGILAVSKILAALYHFYKRELSAKLGNIRFAVFGKSWNDKKTYYDIWSSKPKWFYRYFTKGKGRNYCARLAMKRLLYEARKESLQKSCKNHD